MRDTCSTGPTQVGGVPVFTIVELQDEWGMNALHWAAYLGHAPVVAVLLQTRQGGSPRMSLGAINALDKQRRTVLHWAGQGARGTRALWALATRWRSLATHPELIQQLLLERREGAYCFQQLDVEDRHARTAFAAAALRAGSPHDLLLILLRRSEDEASAQEAGLGSATGKEGFGSGSPDKGGSLPPPQVPAKGAPGFAQGFGCLPSGAESAERPDVVAMLLHLIAHKGYVDLLVQVLVQLRKLQVLLAALYLPR